LSANHGDEFVTTVAREILQQNTLLSLDEKNQRSLLSFSPSDRKSRNIFSCIEFVVETASLSFEPL
jgi:hypothetical protein